MSERERERERERKSEDEKERIYRLRKVRLYNRHWKFAGVD